MIVLDNFTFLSDASSAAQGNELKNIHGESLTLAVDGTFTGTINVKGRQNDVWYDLQTVSLDDLTVYGSITSGGIYKVIGVDGFDRIRCDLAAISSGSVTVTGRLCASGT